MALPHLLHLPLSESCTGILQRYPKACPTHLKEQEYKKMVLPLLEYCACIWDLHHQSDIQKLEIVQHQTAGFVTNKPWSHNDNYSQKSECQQNAIRLKVAISSVSASHHK